MKNMAELTMQLSQMAEDLITGRIDVKTAAEVNNTAGKIINAQKTLLAAAVIRMQIPEIEFPYLEDSAIAELAKPMPKKLRQG